MCSGTTIWVWDFQKGFRTLRFPSLCEPGVVKFCFSSYSSFHQQSQISHRKTIFIIASYFLDKVWLMPPFPSLILEMWILDFCLSFLLCCLTNATNPSKEPTSHFVGFICCSFVFYFKDFCDPPYMCFFVFGWIFDSSSIFLNGRLDLFHPFLLCSVLVMFYVLL